MRVTDAIEKLTIQHPFYLTNYKKAILELSQTAKNKELKWHLALLISRLNSSGKEIEIAWQILKRWALDIDESRIVRVNSIQALYEIAHKKKKFTKDFELLLAEIKKENISSINARIRILNKKTIIE